MHAHSKSHEWEVLIFDTGPLWELVLYSAVHDLKFRSLEGELHHITKSSQHKKLTEFISRFPRRTTSSHVVAEVGAWIKRTKPAGHGDIWRIVRDEFIAMNMDEMALKLLEMRFGEVIDKGVADASVLQLGLRLAERSPQVLTVDTALATECKRSGINAVNLWEIIA